MSAPQLLSDRYELGDTLGYGGMSEVHAGRDIRLGRDVAVKVLRADLARDPQFQERFRREAQNAAALNHPAIVAVYDTGETQTEYGPLPYIVMEYVDGRTLRDIVKTEGPMPGKRAMEVMADVCAALDFSHRHSIIHRDVKPANVMITKNGAVKVMDFGIARALADGQAAVTQTSAVIGTAQYLSPEQARGEMVDARSDVYSAGCVLFELLAGEPPFTGDSPVAVAYQHVREDPRAPSALNPDVAPQLDAIVLKALAKNPANRYQSAAEMRADLVKVLAGSRPSAPMVMTDEDRTSIITGSRPTPALAGNDDYRDYPDEDYEDEEEERRAARRKAWKRVGLVVLCLAVLAGAAWLTTSLLNKKADTVAVPSLVGQDQQNAIAALTKANLKYRFVSVYCENKIDNSPPDCTQNQVGKVVKTDPSASSQVAPLTLVTVSIGGQARNQAIPNVKGAMPDEATKQINAAGFQVSPDSTQQETPDSSLVGKVINTNPAIGTVLPRGSQPVTLVIGKAQTKVQVPDSTGQQYDAAAANLTQLGLTPVKSPKDSPQPAGTVLGQDPEAGTSVVKGAKVTLSVSKGNEFTMPNIVGQDPNSAQSALQSQYKWTGSFTQQGTTPTTDPSQVGKIASSNPAAGANATTNQTIVINVYAMQSTPTTSPGFPGFPGG